MIELIDQNLPALSLVFTRPYRCIMTYIPKPVNERKEILSPIDNGVFSEKYAINMLITAETNDLEKPKIADAVPDAYLTESNTLANELFITKTQPYIIIIILIITLVRLK